ncbi:MAG: DUF393 domain-containing protein [Pirellulales bacterium]
MLSTPTTSNPRSLEASTPNDTANSSHDPTSLPLLPDPDSRANTDVVLYDGHCLFCQRQVKRLHGFDFGGRLSFLSLHDPRVGERYPDLSHEQLMKQMYVVDTAGGRHGGAGAFRYLSRKIPLLWPLAPFLHVPFSLPLWDWLYGQVARRRYLFGGVAPCAHGACQIPRRIA